MIGSLTDLARRPGMPSDVTLRKLIARHPDFPIIRHGDHGRKYRIDIEAAEKFVKGLGEKREMEAAHRQAMIREYGLKIPPRRIAKDEPSDG